MRCNLTNTCWLLIPITFITSSLFALLCSSPFFSENSIQKGIKTNMDLKKMYSTQSSLSLCSKSAVSSESMSRDSGDKHKFLHCSTELKARTNTATPPYLIWRTSWVFKWWQLLNFYSAPLFALGAFRISHLSSSNSNRGFKWQIVLATDSKLKENTAAQSPFSSILLHASWGTTERQSSTSNSGTYFKILESSWAI